MDLKDYYTILELPPSATTDEVKKAYRRMAHEYHPDKSGGDPYAAAQFAIVKEAYEVLTNPSKKTLYLQQRWYAKSAGLFKNTTASTPATILTRMIEIEKYVSKIDAWRFDKQGMTDHLLNFLSGGSIGILNSFGDRGINEQVVQLTISAARGLESDQQVKIFDRLSQINSSEVITRRLVSLRSKTIRSARWAKMKIWLLVLTVAAICSLIWLAGKGK